MPGDGEVLTRERELVEWAMREWQHAVILYLDQEWRTAKAVAHAARSAGHAGLLLQGLAMLEGERAQAYGRRVEVAG